MVSRRGYKVVMVEGYAGVGSEGIEAISRRSRRLTSAPSNNDARSQTVYPSADAFTFITSKYDSWGKLLYADTLSIPLIYIYFILPGQ